MLPTKFDIFREMNEPVQKGTGSLSFLSLIYLIIFTHLHNFTNISKISFSKNCLRLKFLIGLTCISLYEKKGKVIECRTSF